MDERRGSYVYVVRPQGDLWELSFNGGLEHGVLFASQGEALSVADAMARDRWESRGESSSVRVEAQGAESTFHATYGDPSPQDARVMLT